jgi:hypothetical protein
MSSARLLSLSGQPFAMVALRPFPGSLSSVLTLDVVALCACGIVVMHSFLLFNRMPRRRFHGITPFRRPSFCFSSRRTS